MVHCKLMLLALVLLACSLTRSAQAAGLLGNLCPPSDEPRICAKLTKKQLKRLMKIVTKHSKNIGGLNLKWQSKGRFDDYEQGMADLAQVKVAERKWVKGSIRDVLKNVGDPDKGFRYGHVNVQPKLTRKFAKVLGTEPKDFKPSDDMSVGYWISSAGIHAVAHYDEMDNVFITLAGKKRFRILPPEQGLKSGIVPRMHPYARQLKDRRPLKPSVARTIELKRGDVLFLPGLWFHETYTHTPSLSLSFTTLMPSHVQVEKAIGGPGKGMYPENHAWTEEDQVRAYTAYLGFVAGDPSHFREVGRRYDVACQKSGKGRAERCKATDKMIRFVQPDGVAKNELFESIEDPISRKLAIRDHIETVVATVFGYQNAKEFFTDCFPTPCEAAGDKSEL